MLTLKANHHRQEYHRSLTLNADRLRGLLEEKRRKGPEMWGGELTAGMPEGMRSAEILRAGQANSECMVWSLLHEEQSPETCPGPHSVAGGAVTLSIHDESRSQRHP